MSMSQDKSENSLHKVSPFKSWKLTLIKFLILFCVFFGLISCYHFYREAQREAGHTGAINVVDKSVEHPNYNLPKYTDIVSTVEEDGGVSIFVLGKRNNWNWIGNAAVAGFLISAGVPTGGWAVASCMTIAGPACWVGIAVAMVAGTVGTIFATAAGRPGNGWTSSNAKREESSSFSFGDSTYLKVEDGRADRVNSTITDAGLTFKGLWEVYDTVSLKKRSNNVTDTVHMLQFDSPLGSHAAVHLNTGLDSMVNDITEDENPGSLESTLRYTDQKVLHKRYNYFDAQWISWAWDNANNDLLRIAANDRGLEEEEYDSSVYNYFRDSPAWKYCWTVTDNPHPGEGEDYNQLGAENAIHGELYFNTYGGVDGYCNDNKDGAQCSGNACEE